jgi:ubiquinone/menaquinone biosynthesis C-methylase UbiE
MLARAREKLGDQADLRQGEAASLPWPEASFDLVTCVDSFHHYPDAMAVLTGMARVCRPGGILLIADLWFPQPLRSLANHFLPLGKNGDVRIRSGMEMGRLVKTAGFTVRAWHLLSLDSALLVAARE